jgi:hypothetical protein
MVQEVGKKKWHETKPTLLEDVLSSLVGYPNLHLAIREDGAAVIRGSFPIDVDGEILDRFLVEITFPDNYDEDLPVVREVGGRVPHRRERHVNPDDGTACLFIPDERWRVWPVGRTFKRFLEVPVRNFFLGQALVERGADWPFGQWAHGDDGIVEFYRELLGTQDIEVVTRYLDCLSVKKVKDHRPCPCGSGRQVVHCHWGFIKDLKRKVAREDAQRSLDRIRLMQRQTR